MFYWAILHKGVSELVTKVYEGQKLSPVKNDWFLQIQSDLKYCNIDLSEEEIRNMKEMKFKTLVKKNIQAVGREYLIELKEKHSKSDGLTKSNRCQGYLTSNKLTLDEKQLLFQLRTRTFNYRQNFKNKYGSELACFSCKEQDTQQHLLKNCTVYVGIDTEDSEYEDIFKSTAKQIKITKIMKKIINKRNLLLKNSSI